MKVTFLHRGCKYSFTHPICLYFSWKFFFQFACHFMPKDFFLLKIWNLVHEDRTFMKIYNFLQMRNPSSAQWNSHNAAIFSLKIKIQCFRGNVLKYWPQRCNRIKYIESLKGKLSKALYFPIFRFIRWKYWKTNIDMILRKKIFDPYYMCLFGYFFSAVFNQF